MTCPECGLGIPAGEPACPICGFAADPAAVEQAERRHALPGFAGMVRRTATPTCGTFACRCTGHGPERPARRSRVSTFFRALGNAVAAVPRIVDRVLFWSIHYGWDFLPADSWGLFERRFSAAFVFIGRRIGGWIGTVLWNGFRYAVLLVILAIKGIVVMLTLLLAIIAGVLSVI